MSRNQAGSRPVANMFALSRLHRDCYYQPIRVDFSPIQRPSHQIQQIIPRFNTDGLYFTSAFILPRQLITNQQALRVERSKFDARCVHYQTQIQDKKTPEYRPTDNNYCQLCAQQFVSYWEHVNAKYHKRMINSSKFNRDILQLCKKMERVGVLQTEAKTKHVEKKKTIVKSNNKRKNQPKQSCPTKAKESLITMDDNQLQQSNFCSIRGIFPEEQKKLEESLKITLQLGNCSTNLLSSNIFKDILKNNT